MSLLIREDLDYSILFQQQIKTSKEFQKKIDFEGIYSDIWSFNNLDFFLQIFGSVASQEGGLFGH